MLDHRKTIELFPSKRTVIALTEEPRAKRNIKAVGIVSELVAMERFAAAGFWIFFNCYSSHAHRGASPTYYGGKIDAFAVYCPDNDEFYVVPINSPAVTLGAASLRVAAPANNIRKTINWAKDYRFDENNPDILHVKAVSSSGAADGD